jgi:hypothetical protein
VGSPSLLDWVVNWRQAPFHLAEATLGGGREGGGGGQRRHGKGGCILERGSPVAGSSAREALEEKDKHQGCPVPPRQQLRQMSPTFAHMQYLQYGS